MGKTGLIMVDKVVENETGITDMYNIRGNSHSHILPQVRLSLLSLQTPQTQPTDGNKHI